MKTDSNRVSRLESDYSRALQADPRLREMETMVKLLVALAPTKRSKIPMCVGCVWDVIKPLIVPLVGWTRGYPPEMASDSPPSSSWEPVPMSTLLEKEKHDDPQELTETEKWLRTSAAYDAVTDVWLRWLEEADPGNGHGLGRPGKVPRPIPVVVMAPDAIQG